MNVDGVEAGENPRDDGVFSSQAALPPGPRGGLPAPNSVIPRPGMGLASRLLATLLVVLMDSWGAVIVSVWEGLESEGVIAVLVLALPGLG